MFVTLAVQILQYPEYQTDFCAINEVGVFLVLILKSDVIDELSVLLERACPLKIAKVPLKSCFCFCTEMNLL